MIVYSRSILNYLERITLSKLTRMMRIIDPMAITVETPRIDSEYSLEKEFTKLIYMDTSMVLYLIINQVDLCHGYVCDFLT